MANLRIGYLNFADLATLTASPIVTSTGPVTYLANDARGDIMQSTLTNPHQIKGTWGGTAYTVSQLTLWRLNVLYNYTIRLELYSDAAWTTSIYNSGAIDAFASGLFDNWGWSFVNRYFTPVAGVKSFRVTVSNPTNANFVFQAARLYLGPYAEAPYNPQYGMVPGRESNAKQNRSEGGSLRSLAKAHWRTLAFDMIVNTEADRAAWDEIGQHCGTWNSFVASVFPEFGGTQERDFTLFGKFEKHPGERLSGYNRYDFSLKILEL